MCNILIFPLSRIVLYCCNKYCNISIYGNIVSSLIYIYSRTSIIRIPVCHFNVIGVQINEFVWISELSDKIHYLASYIQ